MALTDKFFGPMTLTFRDFASATEVIAGVKRDTATFNIETLADREEFEDGSAIDTEAGRRVTLEGDITDVVAADFDTIEALAGPFSILFASTGKLITINSTAAQPNTCHMSMVDGKMHFKVMNNWPLGTSHATMFAITTP